MRYSFSAHGHPNILATHRTTLEITKDSELTKKGNCIVAVAADFSLERIREIIRSCHDDDKIRLTTSVDGMNEEITAVANKNFGSGREIVLRKSNFVSERTLGINSSKAAADLSRGLVEKLKHSSTAVSVTIETL